MKLRLNTTSSREQGAVMVEAAIWLPVFLSLVFGLFEISRVVYQAVNLQFAVSRVARLSVVNNTISGSEPVRRAAIKSQIIGRIGAAVGVTLSTDEVVVCRASQPTCSPGCVCTNPSDLDTCSPAGCFPESAGRGGEWIVIRINRELPIFLNNYTAHVNATALVKNEPFAS